jgi:hypothetical protein
LTYAAAMHRVAGLVIFLSLLSPARAELTKVGEFSLTDKVKKAGFAKTTVFGCKGNVKHDMGTGKITSVTFRAEGKCDAAAIEAAIRKEYPGEPLKSTDGAIKLWEGKTSSVMLTGTEVRLGFPGPGAKRTCFAADGFAAFYQTFKAAVASGKADAAAASFKFPIKDFEDTVVIKNPKAFAKKWPSMLDAADAKALAGDLRPTCDNATDSYSLSLRDSNISLEAKQIGDRWFWVEINDQASG